MGASDEAWRYPQDSRLVKMSWVVVGEVLRRDAAQTRPCDRDTSCYPKVYACQLYSEAQCQNLPCDWQNLRNRHSSRPRERDRVGNILFAVGHLNPKSSRLCQFDVRTARWSEV